MHRIDSNGAVAGLFQPGNPAIGQQATQLDSDWHNAVQEELCNVIETAGIALEKSEHDQLYEAIVAIAAGVVGDGSGAVPTTRQVLTSGLATGGGDLAGDRTIAVPIASSAEVLAGTSNARAITPLALASVFGAGLGDNGYVRIPGGLIIQWGIVRATRGEGIVSVTFPVSFAEKCYVALPVGLNSSAVDNYDVWVQNVSRSVNGASFFYQFDGGGGDYLNGLDYIAIGK